VLGRVRFWMMLVKRLEVESEQSNAEEMEY